MDDNFSKQTAKAGTWMYVAIFFAKFVDFFLLLVFARMLSPQDFAVMALGMVFVQLTEAVLELPIAQALIRVPKLERAMFDTAFTLSFLRAVFISGLLVLLAPVSASVLNDDRMTLLVMILAIGPAMRGLVSPKLEIYARKLDFRRHAVVEISGKLAALVIALSVAVYTRSYWALAVASITTPIVMAIVSYFQAPYRPRFSLREWRHFADMIGWNTASQIFTATSWQIDIVFLSRFVTPDVLGKFNIAQRLAATPMQIISIPIGRPFLAAFSALREKGALHGGYRKASSGIFMITAPIMALLAIMSEPLIAILFSEEWHGAAGYLSPLALIVLLIVFCDPMRALAMSLNKTRLIAANSALEVAIKVPLLYFSIKHYGVYGVILAQAISRVFSVGLCMFIVKHLIQFDFKDQIKAIYRPLVGLAALTFVAFAGRSFISYGDMVSLVITTGTIAALGLGAYIVSVWVTWRSAGRPDGLEKMAQDFALALAARVRNKTLRR